MSHDRANRNRLLGILIFKEALKRMFFLNLIGFWILMTNYLDCNRKGNTNFIYSFSFIILEIKI